MMNMVFHSQLDRFIIAFIDDILIYSHSRKEHAEHLRTISQTLRHWHLYAKFGKCQFQLDRVVFLGHEILAKCIFVDLQKIKDLVNWECPTNGVEVRSFVGLASYYSRLVEGFSKITLPLTKLTMKNAKFEWIDDCEQSLQGLKIKLTSTPVLTLLSGKEEFIIYSDASRKGLGCVLMQYEEVIAYASCQLKQYELNYPTMIQNSQLQICFKDQETLFVQSYEIYKDHKSLKYLYTKKKLHLRQHSWFDLIAVYDCIIDYHPGKMNVVADSLSRKTLSLISYLKASYLSLLIDLRSLGIDLAMGEFGAPLAHLKFLALLLTFIVDYGY